MEDYSCSRSELASDLIRSPINFPARLRNIIRNGFLTTASIFQNSNDKNFVRCLAAHYVFDDQRNDFEFLMKRLLNFGEFIDTNTLLALLKEKVPLAGRYYHLSFDDGLGCLYRNAFPVLDKYKIPSIIFVNSSIISNDDPYIRMAWLQATNYDKSVSVMTWKQLSQAQSSGIEIGAHTRSHCRLSEISSNPDLLEREIHGCKLEIEENLNQACQYLAWPYGKLKDIDEVSLSAIRLAGYKASFGLGRSLIQPGVTSPFMIPRHHFEPQWDWRHIKYFALGGMENFLIKKKFRLNP